MLLQDYQELQRQFELVCNEDQKRRESGKAELEQKEQKVVGVSLGA